MSEAPIILEICHPLRATMVEELHETIVNEDISVKSNSPTSGILRFKESASSETEVN